MSCFTYILYSPSHDRFYIGQTLSVEHRLNRHNSGLNKSTKAYIPWELILSIECDNRSEAMSLEKKLKNLSKTRILEFIQKYKTK